MSSHASTFTLMPHQEEGVSFLLERGGALLAYEQGLGKTLVAIEAFRRAKAAGRAERLLVVCPNSLKRNWAAELKRFLPSVDAEIAEGPPKARRRILLGGATVVITSYETARVEVTSILALLGRSRTALVLDESHAAKNTRSLISAVAKVFAPHARFRWLLSGTPVTNTPADLHNQVEIIEPMGRPLGSLKSFLSVLDDPAHDQEVRRELAKFVLRRTKEQCLDLPDKIHSDIYVELPGWQRALYNAMRDAMVCSIQAMSGDEYRAFASTALAQLTRLAQLASNHRLLFPEDKRVPGKFLELDGIVREVASGSPRKVIIWSSYVRSIDELVERFADLGAVALYGGTPASERQGIAARFQGDPSVRVLVANPAAAGTGFTLTASNLTIYESLSWRYDFYAQGQDRNHRIGQTLPVTYLRLIAADTIEQAIASALERKSSMAASLLGDRDPSLALSGLTQEQMCNLLITSELPHG